MSKRVVDDASRQATTARDSAFRVQPHIFPDPPPNLPPHGKPLVGIAAGLVVMPGTRQGGRTSTLAEEGYQVVGIPTDLLVSLLASTPTREHGTRHN